jgi:hypothetical protein
VTGEAPKHGSVRGGPTPSPPARGNWTRPRTLSRNARLRRSVSSVRLAVKARGNCCEQNVIRHGLYQHGRVRGNMRHVVGVAGDEHDGDTRAMHLDHRGCRDAVWRASWQDDVRDEKVTRAAIKQFRHALVVGKLVDYVSLALQQLRVGVAKREVVFHDDYVPRHCGYPQFLDPDHDVRISARIIAQRMALGSGWAWVIPEAPLDDARETGGVLAKNQNTTSGNDGPGACSYRRRVRVQDITNDGAAGRRDRHTNAVGGRAVMPACRWALR